MPVVGPAGSQHARIVEASRADDREESLRPVEVDVCVQAEEHMPQRRKVRLLASRVECDPPRSGHGVAAAVGVQRVHVEFGEREVPAATKPAKPATNVHVSNSKDRPTNQNATWP